MLTVVGCPDDDTLVAWAWGQVGDEALPAIDRHVDACGDCQAVVVGLASGSGSAAPVAARFRRGDSIGRYLVLGSVGGGAMATVYAAHDPELDRQVAIKVLHRGRAGDELRREAQALARLAHPNVVTVFEVGDTGELLYLVMELVPGRTMRAWLAATPRSTAVICERFAQAARGLAAAHAAGLVHRDVKPDNLIVDREGRVRVTDFGLAESEGDAHQPRRLAGTPAYMAPEQLAGDPVDARADQFGLAVSLFEALHGQRPHAGTELGELRRAIDARGSAARRTRRVPGWLTGAIERALSPLPADRWPDLSTLADELERDRRRPARVAVTAAAAVALVIGTMVATRGDDPTAAVEPCTAAPAAWAEVWNPEARARLEGAFAAAGAYGATAAPRVVAAVDAWGASWVEAHRASCRATRVSGEQSEALMDRRMACLSSGLGHTAAVLDRVSRGDAAAVLGAVDAVTALPEVDACADVDRLAGLPPPPPGIDQVERALAPIRAALAVGAYADAGRDAADAVARARALGYLPLVAEAELAAAEAALRGGDAAGAEAAAFRAVWAAGESRDDHRAARAWLAVVAALGAREDYAAASFQARHAAAAVARIRPGPRLTSALHNAAGLVALGLGDHARARRELERALELRLGSVGEDHVDTARTLTNLGELARLDGDLDRARRWHERARAADRRALGDGHPSDARHLHNLAGIDRARGDLDAAEARYRQALAIEREHLGGQHPELALTTNSLGLVCFARGDLACAEARYGEAMAIFAAAGDAREAISAHNLGLVRARKGDHRGAIEHFDRALAIYRDTIGPAHPRAAATAAAREQARARLPRGSAPAPVVSGEGPRTVRAAPQPAIGASPPDRLPPSTPPPGPASPPAPAGTYGGSRAWDTP